MRLAAQGIDARAHALQLESFDGAADDLPGPARQGRARDRSDAFGRREDVLTGSLEGRQIARGGMDEGKGVRARTALALTALMS